MKLFWFCHLLSIETAPSMLSTLSDDCYYTSKSPREDDDSRDAEAHVCAGARQLSMALFARRNLEEYR